MNSHTPWRSEYSLEADEVQRLITSNTDLVVEHVEFLGEGWDFFNWLVNHRWVFRFPKRHADIDTLVQERNLLKKLELPIPHPVFSYWVDASTSFPRPFAGYEFLEGLPLLNFPSSDCDLEAIGKTLGSTLTELHQLNLTPPRAPVDPLSLWRGEEAIVALVEKVAAELSPEITKVVAEALNSYRIRARTTHQVTTHNDLGVEHILMHDFEHIAAIIDWADAATANAFVDFAGIWAWGGDSALVAVLNHYPLSPTTEDLAQIRTHGVSYLLENIAYGRDISDETLLINSTSWVQDRVVAGELNNVYAQV